MLDPRSIQLTDEQKDQLAAAANSLGKDWSEVLAEAIKKATELANRDGNKTTRFGAGLTLRFSRLAMTSKVTGSGCAAAVGR